LGGVTDKSGKAILNETLLSTNTIIYYVGYKFQFVDSLLFGQVRLWGTVEIFFEQK